MTSHDETAGDWGYPEPGGEVITEGHSGSDTSRDKALGDARAGRDVKRRAKTLTLMREAGARGLTWWEIDDFTGWGHGRISGALSNLHKEGRLARLADTRGRSKVYVLSDLTLDRATEKPGRNKPAEGYDEKDMAEVEQRGYQRGFDDGESVCNDELTAAMNRATADGYKQGDAAARKRFADYLTALNRTVKATYPRTVHVHTQECHLTRTPCLMDAVLRAVLTTSAPAKGRSA